MPKTQKLQELNTALGQAGNNESAIQTTLETHPELLPLPFLLNHRHHFNLLFKKFPLPNAQETDFLYLTKSTVEWWVVLVEIESSNKKIFSSRGNGNPVFHSNFNNAYDQILSWKAYLDNNNNQASMKQAILPLLMHMHQNTISFKYVLIIGRNAELNNQTKTDMFRQKNTDNIKVMTYDSLINSFNENPIDSKIVAVKTTNGYRIENLNNANTNLFAYLQSGQVILNDTIKNELIAMGYNIAAWENGQQLVVNDKQPM
jgi:hypothetical protein